MRTTLLVAALLCLAIAGRANAQYGLNFHGYNAFPFGYNPYSMQTAAQRQIIYRGGYGYGGDYGRGYDYYDGDSWTPGSAAYELRLLRQSRESGIIRYQKAEAHHGH